MVKNMLVFQFGRKLLEQYVVGFIVSHVRVSVDGVWIGDSISRSINHLYTHDS
jgi:hypothetical protein